MGEPLGPPGGGRTFWEDARLYQEQEIWGGGGKSGAVACRVRRVSLELERREDCGVRPNGAMWTRVRPQAGL